LFTEGVFFSSSEKYTIFRNVGSIFFNFTVFYTVYCNNPSIILYGRWRFRRRCAGAYRNDKSLGLEERLLHDEADGDSEGPEDSDVDGDVLGPINCKSLGLTVGLLLGEA
jgi:hypothetical protein